MAKKAFNLGDYLQAAGGVQSGHAATEQIVLIELDRIDPDPNNFYSLRGIDELAANIELVGLLDALRVRPNGERFTIVSGHRRRAALQLIRDGGSEMFADGVPCIVEYGEASEAMRELRLIYANASTRVMSPADLSKQAERVEALLYELKKQGVKFPGRMRDHVAEACKVSATKIARLHAIRDNLDGELLKLFDDGRLNEAAAYELQKLPEGVQDYLGAQKKIQNSGISGDRAAEMAKRAEHYLAPKCVCPDGSACTHTLPRFKQTATASLYYETCYGGCCLQCGRSESSCPYRCPQARKKLEEEKAEKKAEEQIAAEKETKRQEKVAQRLAAEYAPLLALAEKAGLDDKTRLNLAACYSVKDLRECAQGRGFHSCQLSDRMSPTWNVYAQDLAKTADVLGVSVDFLLGRTVVPETADEVLAAMGRGNVSGLNTDAASVWQQGTPPLPGRYLCMVDLGTSHLHEQQCDWDGRSWSAYGRPVEDVFKIVFWVPLPARATVRAPETEEEEDGEDRV